MAEIRDRVREELTRLGFSEKQIEIVFSTRGLAVVDRDAELPDSPWAKQADSGDMYAVSKTSGYYCCQQDMKEAGWVQEVK